MVKNSTKKKTIPANGSDVKTTILPYVAVPSKLDDYFQKLQDASTPLKVTTGFFRDTLNLKSNSDFTVIKLLRDLDFLNSDNTPNENYEKLRDKSEFSKILGQSLKIGYASLFERNENVPMLEENVIKELIKRTTNMSPSNSTLKQINATFLKLRELADFSTQKRELQKFPEIPAIEDKLRKKQNDLGLVVSLNLQLPSNSTYEDYANIMKAIRNELSF